MRNYLLLLFLICFTRTTGQTLFHKLGVEKAIMTLPIRNDTASPDAKLINAIEAVDKNYRRIADTLYSYKSRNHTIFQTILIETNDSILINPLLFGDKIHLSNIIFDNESLNRKLEGFADHLRKTEKAQLYKYLENDFDNFSIATKKLKPQPIRI